MIFAPPSIEQKGIVKMRLSVITLFTAAVFAAPFVFAQTAQPAQAAGTAAPQTSTATSGTRRDIVSYVEELAGNTAAQLRAVQDENAELETRVIELERKIAVLQDSNQKLLNEVAAAKRQSAADAAALETQMKAIRTQIEKLASMPVPSATVPTPVSIADEYDIYEVQKGATLSVIAKAYHVSVQDIKNANNLKSDVLQIGQKLKIPRK